MPFKIIVRTFKKYFHCLIPILLLMVGRDRENEL
jgi:hypothetical protein